MSQLDLDPEAEKRILEAARASARPKRLTDQEFSNLLDGLAMYSDKIPDLSDQAYSRESIYQDRA